MRKEATGYIAGTWKACCDRCGFNFRNTELRLEWTGLRVCRECFEYRHPQDLIQGVADRQSPPWVRPEPVPFIINSLQTEDGSVITDDSDQPILV